MGILGGERCMTDASKSICPGCGVSRLSDALEWKAQPVILNYRFPTPESARNVPRRDMEIRQCTNCGLIFNATVDLSVIPYDERYENSQSSSPLFLDFMRDTGRSLTERYNLTGGTIMEVGCGKGGFLRMICETANARGLGYDTSCEEAEGVEQDGVSFFKRYAGTEDVPPGLNAIICRHVVEHVPQIGEFMRLLADLSRAGGGSVVYVETPKWEWIVENEAFWDVFYEHCNYFPMPCLRYLAELGGLEVLDQRTVFGGQYQALELRSRETGVGPASPGIAEASSLSAFAATVTGSRLRLRGKLEEAGASAGWGIWGAGAKGVSLASTFPDLPPRLVVDSNPAKQGSFIPGTDIPVVAPSDGALGALPVLLIANPNYLNEIRASLSQKSLSPILLTV